ncbi:MAG: hypothetical protein IJS09_06195 [Treponema sp.]|nr:hypothetical protein [Treponema sp.]
MIQKKDIPESKLKYSQTESKISFTENNRTYYADNSNKKRILGFRVDGGLIKSTQTRKCDYALIVENDLCYLIELKGQGIDDACEQLNKTIKIFSDEYDVNKIVCRIVVSRYNTHKLKSEKHIALERKLRIIQKKFDIKQKSLDIKEKILREII